MPNVYEVSDFGLVNSATFTTIKSLKIHAISLRSYEVILFHNISGPKASRGVHTVTHLVKL